MHDSDASSFEQLIMTIGRAGEQTPLVRWQEAHLAARRPVSTLALSGTEYLGVLSSPHTMSLCW
ncbi:MAG TPA: hypothetical protein VHX38_20560 [Pseudonocardiaceae bacterium]|jgi:hypothetical protein|nr:hypothetical protein [Pseudonocardiaceae bacterium]